MANQCENNSLLCKPVMKRFSLYVLPCVCVAKELPFFERLNATAIVKSHYESKALSKSLWCTETMLQISPRLRRDVDGLNHFLRSRCTEHSMSSILSYHTCSRHRQFTLMRGNCWTTYILMQLFSYKQARNISCVHLELDAALSPLMRHILNKPSIVW